MSFMNVVQPAASCPKLEGVGQVVQWWLKQRACATALDAALVTGGYHNRLPTHVSCCEFDGEHEQHAADERRVDLGGESKQREVAILFVERL